MAVFFQVSSVLLRLLIGLLCLPLLFLVGCVPYRYSSDCFQKPSCSTDQWTAYNQQSAACHWLYQVVPRHRCQIRSLDMGHWMMWALFGNDDDGVFGEEPTARFRLQTEPSIYKALAWGWRNPLHNFCFYVIGSAHRHNDELTLVRMTPCYREAFVYRPSASTVFAGKESSFFLALHGGKPFVSARIVWSKLYESRFYLGWRCRGNFGIRFNPWSHRKRRS